MRRASKYKINTRDKKVCPGSLRLDEKVPDEKQDLGNKVLSGEFRWMRRRHTHDLEERADCITTSSTDETSRNSGIDTY